MAIERPVINLTNKVDPTAELRKAFRAKMAGVVSRGWMLDRLSVALPADKYGEWISNDPVAIAEAQAMGFELDKEFATKNKLHSNAAGEAIVGDTIFMTMPRWMKEEIDILKEEEKERFHGMRGKGKPAEETQYAANISKETPLINDSKQTNAELTTLVEGT